MKVAHLRLISPKDVWGSVWERNVTFKHMKELGVDIDYYYADNDTHITPEESLKYDILNIGEFSFGTWQSDFIRAHPHPVVMFQETSLQSLLDGSKELDLDLIKKKPYFIALTNWSRDLLIHFGVNGDRIKVIPCAAELDIFKPGKIETDMKKPVFLYVGSFNKRKGAHHAVTAFAKAGIGTLLMVRGEFNNEDNDYILKLINDLGVSDKVIIKEFPESLDKLPEFYHMADVVIYPQSYEDGEPIQFGHPLLWGLSCGLPLISLDMGGAGDMIATAQNGFSCESYENLSEAMKLFSNEKLKIVFGNFSRQIAEKVFNPMLIAKRYEYYYKKIIEGN